MATNSAGAKVGIAVVQTVITPWVAYTPIFVGFGTVTDVGTFYWRQVGESIEVEGRFSAGTSTAIVASMSLPGSLTTAPQGGVVGVRGRWTRLQFASANGRKSGPMLMLLASNTVQFTNDDYVTAVAPSTAINGNSIAASELVEINFSVPITGWSATVAYGAGAASTTLSGLVTTGTQSFAGVKTFQDNSVNILNINRSSAGSAGFAVSQNGVAQFRMGYEGSAGDTVNGSSINDIVIRNQISTGGFKIGGSASNVVLGGCDSNGAWILGPTSAIGGTTYAGNKIVGKTDGSAIAAGYVGEGPFEASGTLATVTAIGGTDIATLTLGVGVWLVSASSYSDNVATQTGAVHRLYVKGVNSGVFGKDYAQFITAAGQAHAYTFPNTLVNIAAADANKTVKINQKAFTSAGNGSGFITAMRIN